MGCEVGSEGRGGAERVAAGAQPVPLGHSKEWRPEAEHVALVLAARLRVAQQDVLFVAS